MTSKKILVNFGKAVDQAKKASTHSYIHNKHGAVVVIGGKTVGIGYNKTNNSPIKGNKYGCYTHAEVAAMLNYLKSKNSKFKGRKVRSYEKKRQIDNYIMFKGVQK